MKMCDEFFILVLIIIYILMVNHLLPYIYNLLPLFLHPKRKGFLVVNRCLLFQFISHLSFSHLHVLSIKENTFLLPSCSYLHLLFALLLSSYFLSIFVCLVQFRVLILYLISSNT